MTAPDVGVAPLTEAERERFWGSAEDPPAEVLLAWEREDYGRHYVSCDERYLYLFDRHLRGVGGGYVGVGTFQSYLFIGIMRPELAWLMDYDPWVVHLHRAYAVMFEEAPTIDAFLAFWDEDREDETVAFLRDRLADDPGLALIIEVFEEAVEKTGERMAETSGYAEEAGIPTWLTDAEEYAFVRAFVRAGRARPMLGNLFEAEALAGIADTSRALQVPIRGLYLSNAEAYWDEYPAQFRENIAAAPFDERSVVLRTFGAGRHNPDDYFYGAQPAALFQAWLTADDVEDVQDVWDRERPSENPDFPLQWMDDPPPNGAP